MSDDELIENFTQQMGQSGPTEEQMQRMCKAESGKILGQLNRFKLEIAKCRANVALECSAKQEAVRNCNSLQENPQPIAQNLVNNVCRRFAPPEKLNLNGKLYDIASKFYDSDPAFANQLGDTADKTAEEKKGLGFTSYLFGDGDYGGKLKERAAKLREVKERLASSGEDDSETLEDLDEQIKQFEDEGNKFSNFLDVSRLGGLFGGN